MSKLEELSRAIAAELKDKQAQLTAADTQHKALQQAHQQTLAQVSEAKDDLQRTRGALTEINARANRIIAEANEQAAEIRAEAEKLNREAGATLAAAQEQAKQIVAEAKAEAKRIDGQTAKKRQDFDEASRLFAQAKAGWQEVKDAARKFAES